MLIVETIAKIRRYYFVKKKGIKEISRDLNISRNTVRKIIRGGQTKHEYNRQQQPLPKLGAYIEVLNEQLELDWQRIPKRRLTAVRLFEFLKQQGYEGGYDSVRKYVCNRRRTKGKVPKQTYIPLSFSPGEAYQFDWSHELAVINGETGMCQ